MLENINQHLKDQEAPYIEALSKLVSIPSVFDGNAKDTPFGKDIDDALKVTLQLAESLGFETHYGEGGYYGYADIGEGEELIGILGHLDVVPAGNLEDWHSAPFDPVVKDGNIYGRGVQDDKGPTVAALFAVKALQDAGVTFNKRLRFIFGTDEESLWGGITKYLENEEIPSMGFSPDANFPLIYAEKGLLQLKLTTKNESGLKFTGGNAFNAVPDSAFYDGDEQEALSAKLDELGFGYKKENGGIKIIGKAAHAMVPEKGINAIARLCVALKAIGIESKAINFVAQEVQEDPNATLIFGDVNDEPTGKLKFNVGKIELGEEEILSIDTRIPVTIPKEEIVEKLLEVAQKYDLTYSEYDWLAPIYLPLDHPLIETLLAVYQKVTGDTETKPRTSGGATYARAIPNCVAYGPNFPHTALTEHQPNEYIPIQDLHTAMEVYAHAIYEITR